MGEPALQLPAQAAQQAAKTTTLRVIQGGAGETATGAGEVAGEGLLAGAGVAIAAIAAGLLVLLWPSDIAPDPPDTPPCPDPCEKLLQDIRDAIDRNKRDFGNQGIHGVRQRFQELINGPCGPGQRPYRVNSRGDYVPTPVWENHIQAFNETKAALQNRFNKALDAGCDIPDDLLQDAIDAENLEPPSPDQWKGDPSRPCLDSPPPSDWYGPPESPGSRGV